MEKQQDTGVMHQTDKHPELQRAMTTDNRKTQSGKMRLFISVNEEPSREWAFDYIPEIFYGKLKYIIENHLWQNPIRKDGNNLTITREKLCMQECMGYYQFNAELGNGWRLLTSDLRPPPTNSNHSLYLSVYSFRFLEMTMKVSEEIQKLRQIGENHREECYKRRIQAQQRDQKSKIRKVTCLYGSPLYQLTAQKQHLMKRPVRYLRELNAFVTAVNKSERKVILEVEEFNQSSRKRALQGVILYCIVHSQDQSFFGENKFGKLENVSMDISLGVTEINNAHKVNEDSKLELLILQTNQCHLLKIDFHKYAKQVLLINSNVLRNDQAAVAFIGSFMTQVMNGISVADARINALNEIGSQEDFKNKFMCCCLHTHSDTYRKKQPSEPGTAQANFASRNPYYSMLSECRCQQSFQLSNTSLQDYLKSCNGKLEDHQLTNKFIYLCEEKESRPLTFQPGIIPSVPSETNRIHCYQMAQKNCYDLSDQRQRLMLASFMEYLKSCQNQNRRRLVLNIFGAKGYGKEHMKSMLVNYLTIKRLTKKCQEVTQKIDQAEAQKRRKGGYDLVILDITMCELELLKELVELLAVNNTKIIILSEVKVDLNDVKDFECQQLNQQDAFMFVLRELGVVKQIKSKRYHLTYKEQNILREKIAHYKQKLTCSRLKRLVDGLKVIDYSQSVERFLMRNLVNPSQQFEEPMEILFNKNPEVFKALLVMSQWCELTAATCEFLFTGIGLKTVNIKLLEEMKLLDHNTTTSCYTVKSSHQVNLEHAMKHQQLKRCQQDLMRLLINEATLLFRECSTSIKESQQEMIDFTICNPTSTLSVYLNSNWSVPPSSYSPKQSSLTKKELYEFLYQGFFIPDTQNICLETLGSESTWLAILVINSLLVLHIQTADMSVILRKVNQLKALKPKPQTWEVQQTIIAVIALELQLQVLLTELITAHHTKNKKNIANQEKKIEKCYLYMQELQRVLQQHSQKQEPKQDYKRKGQLKTIVAVAKFNTFLTMLVEYTKLMTHIVPESEDIPPPKSPSKKSLAGSIDQLPVTKLLSSTNEEQTKTLLKLRREYELVSNDIADERVKQNLKCIKELVRLIVESNPHLKTNTTHRIPVAYTRFAAYHQLFQSMHRYHKNLAAVQIYASDKEYLDSIAQLINMHKQLRTTYQQLQKSSKDVSAGILYRLLKQFLNSLKASITKRLEKRTILTVLSAYPQNCQCTESGLGVHVQFKLERLRNTGIIIEERILTPRSLAETLKRGSKYICLWFEYTSDTKYTSAAKMELLYDDDAPATHTHATSSHRTVDQIIAELPKQQIEQQACYSHIQTTIFVCGSIQLAEKLSQRYPAYNIVSLSFEPSKTPFNFYLKKLFQHETVQYFVLNLQKKGKQLSTLNEQLRRHFKDFTEKAMYQFAKEIAILNLTSMQQSVKPTQEMEQPQLHPNFSSPAELQHRISSTTSILQLTEAPPKDIIQWTVSPVDVYLYRHQDKLLESLRQYSRISLSCQNKDLLQSFIKYLRSICEKKHLYQGGVYVVNWTRYHQEPITSESDPVEFIERQLSKRLPVLTWKPTLLIMEQSQLMFKEAVTRTATFEYLIDYLKQHTKLSILFCGQTQTPSQLKLIGEHMKLMENQFKELRSDNNQLLEQNNFDMKS